MASGEDLFSTPLEFEWPNAIPSANITRHLYRRSNGTPKDLTVCRFWIRGRCQKDKDCEFVHIFDEDKVPLCSLGNKCNLTDCLFRHVEEEDKAECIPYSLGFCPLGPRCKDRYVLLTPTSPAGASGALAPVDPPARSRTTPAACTWLILHPIHARTHPQTCQATTGRPASCVRAVHPGHEGPP